MGRQTSDLEKLAKQEFAGLILAAESKLSLFPAKKKCFELT